MRAAEALRRCDVIVGYTVYVELVKEHFANKRFLTTPMKKEIERCRLAFEEANKGYTVAMICSGDAGVYGMSGLMLEIGQEYPHVEVEVIPGVTAPPTSTTTTTRRSPSRSASSVPPTRTS